MLTPDHMTRTLLTALLFASFSCGVAPQVDSTSALRVYTADFRQRMNSMWLHLVSARANDLISGTATVSFRILPDGRVTNLRLTSNTGNAALAKSLWKLSVKPASGRFHPPSSPRFRTGTYPLMIFPSKYIQDERSDASNQSDKASERNV